jgi:hypothetical protein
MGQTSELCEQGGGRCEWRKMQIDLKNFCVPHDRKGGGTGCWGDGNWPSYRY